jgi:hypothetical protein
MRDAGASDLIPTGSRAPGRRTARNARGPLGASASLPPARPRAARRAQP